MASESTIATKWEVRLGDIEIPETEWASEAVENLRGLTLDELIGADHVGALWLREALRHPGWNDAFRYCLEEWVQLNAPKILAHWQLERDMERQPFAQFDEDEQIPF